MDSIYFTDPLGLLIELASYRFEPPAGHTHADVLLEAHKLRVERGDHNIAREHLADAIELLVDALARLALGRPRAEEPVLTRRGADAERAEIDAARSAGSPGSRCGRRRSRARSRWRRRSEARRRERAHGRPGRRRGRARRRTCARRRGAGD